MSNKNQGRCAICNAVLVNSRHQWCAFCAKDDPPHGYLVDPIPEAFLYGLRGNYKQPQAIRAVGSYSRTAWRITGHRGLWRRTHGGSEPGSVEAWHQGRGWVEYFNDGSGISHFVPYTPQNIIEADQDKPTKKGSG